MTEKEMKTMSIPKKTWKNVWKLKMRYEFTTMGDTLDALVKIEKDFKPELKEIRK